MDFIKPTLDGTIKLVVSDDFVDQSHVERLLSRVATTHKGHFLRALFANLYSREVGGTKHRGRTNLRPGLSKRGALGGNGEVTRDDEFITPTSCRPIDRGNNRTWTGSDRIDQP